MTTRNRLAWLAVALLAGATALLLLKPDAGTAGEAAGADADGTEPNMSLPDPTGGDEPRPELTRSDSADPTPGATAFRAYARDYVDKNADQASAHMAEHGLTRDETVELTYFALLALESLDWDMVESFTGLPMEEEARRQAWSAMRRQSQQMREELIAQVRAGDDPEARAATIARVEHAYLEEYFRLTGMSPALLDDLLLESVQSRSLWETSEAVAVNAAPPAPAGHGPVVCVMRDPARPDAPPVPVACP